MSRTLNGVEELRKKVDQARGAETYASLAFRLGESEQWLSNKLRGARKIDVPEVVRIATALGLDPVELVSARWPELRAHDRLARLRDLLADAPDDEITRLERSAAARIQPSPILAEAAGTGRAGKRGRTVSRPSPEPEPEGP